MIPPIDKITFAARYTDRRFLVPLERAEWEAVTAEAVSGITDAVISEAVHKLPPPMYAQAGGRPRRGPRARRGPVDGAARGVQPRGPPAGPGAGARRRRGVPEPR